MGGGAAMEAAKPVAGLAACQFVFAVANIMYKLALVNGMDGRIFVAYRFIFATVSLFPLAFLLERKNRPRMTLREVMLSFLTGLFGGSLFQNLYLASINLASITFVSAIFNLAPAFTFILAVLFRLEKLQIGTISGQAKVAGTLVGIGGAMLLTFYEGPIVTPWTTHINLLHSVGDEARRRSGSSGKNQVIGSLVSIITCLSYSIWLIIQAKVSCKYPYHYSTTALLCLMAGIQSTVFALFGKRDAESWRMGFDIRLLAVVYSGVVASGLVLIVLNWCIKKKGPLFAAVFNPLMLAMVALLGSLFLEEKLHLGTVVGSLLIVLGLYMVLWGKGREMAKVSIELPREEELEPSVEVITVDVDSALSRVKVVERTCRSCRF